MAKVQAQYLQPGANIGGGQTVVGVVVSSTRWPSNKVQVTILNAKTGQKRSALWGKYTTISVMEGE
jgi:hypothetical protein